MKKVLKVTKRKTVTTSSAPMAFTITQTKPLDDYELYDALKHAGFPQGGGGIWLQHPRREERVYVPTTGEIYSQFLGDPKDWRFFTDALARAWIEFSYKPRS